MNNAHPLEVLEHAARLLDMSWARDVLPLRASRMLHDRVKPLFGKVGIDGHIVGRLWYQDHVLSSIRRMVDTGQDVVSIRQALVEVRRIADEITPEILLELHGPDPQWTEELNTRMSQEWVRLTVVRARANEPDPDTSVIGRRTVQADLDRIRHVADRAHRLATLVSAHRLDTEEQVVVTDEEVEQLLEDISALYARWSLPLRAVDVDTDIDHFQVGYRLAEALQLYDHGIVTEAMREYLHSLDFQNRVPPRNELVKRMRVTYQFETNGDEEDFR